MAIGLRFTGNVKVVGWADFGEDPSFGVLAVQPSLVKDGLQCIARGQSGGKMSRGCETA